MDLNETKLNETIKHARTFSKQFKAVMEIADILEDIKDIKQLASEAGRKAEKAKQDRDEAVSMMEVVKEQLAVLHTEKQLYEEEAKRILINAEVSRQVITDKAEANRQSIIKDASTAAHLVKEQIEKDKAVHVVNIAKWQEEEKTIQASLLEYTTALADIKKRIG